MLKAKQVTIIGTGLLGASLALALRGKGYGGKLVGVGRREQTLEQARGLGCFDSLTTSTAEALAGAGKSWTASTAGTAKAGKLESWTASTAGTAKSESGAHLAVLAAPLGHFKEIFTKIAECDDENLIVTDVGSTKRSVCELANELLPEPCRFVGSHPMAGSEQQGPMAADAKLFEGKPCVVTPAPVAGGGSGGVAGGASGGASGGVAGGVSGGGTDARAVALVESMWSCVGMRLVRMSPSEHDKAVAMVSHLPHAAAALLVNLAKGAGGGALGIASTGFADTTRIAAGDPDLWVDIFENNKDAVVGSVDQLMEALGRFREVLQGGDSDEMRKLLEDAKRARDGWGGRK